MTRVQRDAADRQIGQNIAVHDRVAKRYEKLHGEIFNRVEQERLRAVLRRARDAIATGASPPRAMDFGCGSGNLTRHLLELDCEVTAADVSPRFLELVEGRFGGPRLSTLLMNGSDLREVADGSFDMIATYSVLHHIPDYLAAIGELARVCKPGGVILLDHEQTEEYWLGNPVYDEFRKAALLPDWGKFLRPSNYVHKLRRLINPRHTNEGDIHVFPDDHIEWKRIETLLTGRGFETVIDEDYLLCRSLYRPEVFERYKSRCTDTRVMAFRKKGAVSRAA